MLKELGDKIPYNWKDHWITISDMEGGGQASAKQVRKINDPGGKLYFLKILNKQSVMERRKRLYREASAFKTLSHSMLPQFIFSNAEPYDNVEDLSFKLYIVMEYIHGMNLKQYIDEFGVLPINDALELTINILDVLQYCHSQDILHRDIKPDNIMLKNHNIHEPVLVDLGLSFNKHDQGNLKTSSENVGNRFLILPEFSIKGSNNKDRRSDITLICGILYYCLTKRMPNFLLNEQNQMPHQSYRLQIDDEEKAKRLNSIFDKGFQFHIDYRYQSIEALLNDILAIKNLKQMTFLCNNKLESYLNMRNTTKNDINRIMYKAFQQIFDYTTDVKLEAIKLLGDQQF